MWDGTNRNDHDIVSNMESCLILVCLAKGIGAGFPMGAFVANKKIGDALKPGDILQQQPHQSTDYSPHPSLFR